MRVLLGVAVLLGACRSQRTASPASSAAPPLAAVVPGGSATTPPASASRAPALSREILAADTPRTTVEGNRFIAPAGWSITVRGLATILAPPETDNAIALIDVRASDADAALAAGWAAYQPEAKRELRVARVAANRDGWTDVHEYRYRIPPNERRGVAADVSRAGGDRWLVVIYDLQRPVGDRREGQVALIYDHLQPRGYERESFAGRTAHKLDAARIAELGRFIEATRQRLGVPGVALGLIQDGEVVFAGGFGVRELGGTAQVTRDTLFMIASNTKSLTTLMLAKLVDENKLTWDTPVTALLPSFKLGDPDTTRRVLVKHLVCACTGMPRQDLEWLFQFDGVTPDRVMAALAMSQPTTGFGELYQYSNALAAAGGYIGGHVAFPARELGAAYDEAMRTRVFGPLGMTATTFDFARALRGDHAEPSAPDIDGKPARARLDVNRAIIPLRPAAAAWSNVNDMLRYVQMELSGGVVVGGKRYIDQATLLARRAPQIAIGKDRTYGMGLEVDTTYGTPVIRHGGDLLGYQSDMLWLPDHHLGAVVLTNSERGGLLIRAFRRKLLEVMFDGKPEAEETIAPAQTAFLQSRDADRKLLTVPADPVETARLARRYASDALGEISVKTARGATIFDMGEWQSEMATRRNPDGTISFVMLRPGLVGFDLLVGVSGGRRTLVMRDAQHEYVFTEQ